MKTKSLLAIEFGVAFLFAASFSAAAQGAVGFVPGKFSPISGPRFVLAVDVNGNGKPCLISANAGLPNEVLVLTNNGSNVFAISAGLHLPSLVSGASYAVTADVNGDGKMDVICSTDGLRNSYANGAVTVFTNNGSGGFGFYSSSTVGLEPQCVAAADLNGDGKCDFISANRAGNTLSIFTNNGAGFGSNAVISVGIEPVFLAVSDVNHDSKLDIVCVSLSGTLTVLTNDGSGSFSLSAILAAGPFPFCVVATNLNGNSGPDLVTANWLTNTLTVFTNDGSGGFLLSATYTVGNGPQSVTAADINGDGKLDLISANYIDNTLTILTNDGSGHFGFNATIPVDSSPFDVIAADLNNDGLMDLVSANSQGSSLNLLTQVSVGPPLLNLVPNAAGSKLSWSSFSTGFVLQTNSDLTTTNWSAAGWPVAINRATNQSISIPPLPSANLFFRLSY